MVILMELMRDAGDATTQWRLAGMFNWASTASGSVLVSRLRSEAERWVQATLKVGSQVAWLGAPRLEGQDSYLQAPHGSRCDGRSAVQLMPAANFPIHSTELSSTLNLAEFQFNFEFSNLPHGGRHVRDAVQRGSQCSTGQ